MLIVTFRTIGLQTPNSRWQNLENVAGGFAGGYLALKASAAKTLFMATASASASGASKSLATQLSDFYINMYIAKQAAPMVQAILLMMIYMLLLIYLVMTNYDIDSTIQMIFIILGIQFFTTLWNFADYLDAQLFVSMFPDATMLGSIATMGANRLILDIVLTLLYVVAPFILLWIMNMAGSKVSMLSSSVGSLGKSPSTKASTGANSEGSRTYQNLTKK